jgi:hypothetical protein
MRMRRTVRRMRRRMVAEAVMWRMEEGVMLWPAGTSSKSGERREQGTCRFKVPR